MQVNFLVNFITDGKKMNFVSEAELKKAREAGGENSDNSDPADKRPLFERLREVRDKKQLEYDEVHALKNQFRGIDDGEADFLSQVERAREEQEARKRQEEQELLKLARQAISAGAHPELPLLLEKPQKAAKSATTNKQASLLSSLVRKRPRSSSSDGEPSSSGDNATKNGGEGRSEEAEGQPPAKQQEPTERVSHCKMVGALPGIPNYSDSSDEAESSTNSESLESELPCVAIFGGKSAPKRSDAE